MPAPARARGVDVRIPSQFPAQQGADCGFTEPPWGRMLPRPCRFEEGKRWWADWQACFCRRGGQGSAPLCSLLTPVWGCRGGERQPCLPSWFRLHAGWLWRPGDPPGPADSSGWDGGPVGFLLPPSVLLLPGAGQVQLPASPPPATGKGDSL